MEPWETQNKESIQGCLPESRLPCYVSSGYPGCDVLRWRNYSGNGHRATVVQQGSLHESFRVQHKKKLAGNPRVLLISR